MEWVVKKFLAGHLSEAGWWIGPRLGVPPGAQVCSGAHVCTLGAMLYSVQVCTASTLRAPLPKCALSQSGQNPFGGRTIGSAAKSMRAKASTARAERGKRTSAESFAR